MGDLRHFSAPERTIISTTITKTGRGPGLAFFMLALVGGIVTTLVAYGSMRQAFLSAMSHEAESMLALTNSYVSTYSRYRSAADGAELPVPATYRAQAIAHFNRTDNQSRRVSTVMVGLPDQWIKTPPTDERLSVQIKGLVTQKRLSTHTELLTIGEDKVLRSVFPSVATTQGCVDCHNQLQQLDTPYQLGDVMGAYVVDRIVGAELRSILSSSAWFGILVAIAIFSAYGIVKYWKRQRSYALQLREIAYRDSLTGCMNRRALFEKVNELSTASRGSVLMVDIDHFKSINDTSGHAAGDTVLEQFGHTLRSCVRPTDWVARVGGEEFFVWLSGCDHSVAMRIGERIREKAEASTVFVNGVNGVNDTRIAYTVSIGVLTIQHQDPFDFSTWMKVVDGLLYRAKFEGRNRLVGANGLTTDSI